MNAAIRSVTRTAIEGGLRVVGIRNGYDGLIAGEAVDLGPRRVGGIIQNGGTILGSSRSAEFRTEAGRQKALRQLDQLHVDGLVVIGGNGSQAGAHALSTLGFPVVGVASTIDNDLFGSEPTLGVDTALNVALEAIDRLKTTASSHQRAFLVEVMGRDCGYLALMAALAGGAEAIVIPELETNPEALAAELRTAYERGKAHAIVVVSEGASYDGEALVHYFRENERRLGFELRLTTLGHVQRGAAPTAADRILGTQLGFTAARALLAGESGTLIGLRASQVAATPLSEAVATSKPLDLTLMEAARVLSR